MSLNKEKKSEVINSYRIHDKDTGSADVQVALLTEKINSLTPHFKSHKKDHHSRRGLLQLVSKRRRLLDYLKGVDSHKYQAILERLNLRK